MRKALLISPNSPEYSVALALRHRLFFKDHAIPLESTPDKDEHNSLHAAIPDGNGGVRAYGRLTPGSGSQWRVSQMVVRPDSERQGLGSEILRTLMDEARKRGARHLVLAARTHAAEFYARFGFKTIGTEFSSARTGVVHVNMRLNLE